MSYCSRALATFVALQHHAWLHSTSLQPYVKTKVEDLPVDGDGLFHKTTDDILMTEDEGQKRAKNLGILTIVCLVYAIEFHDVPRSAHFVATPLSHFLTEVRVLLAKGAIEPVPDSQHFLGFYSRDILVPK